MTPVTLARRSPSSAGTDGPTPSRRRSARAFLIGLLVFVAAFAGYVASSVRLVTDSFWSVYTARSLLQHGDVNLDEYRDRIEVRQHFQVDSLDGHEYYSVPFATSLATVPVVLAVSALDGAGLDHRLARGQPDPVDSIAASLVTALAVLMMFLVARRLTPRLWVAVASTVTFAFGTQAWSTASRAMWMHGPSMLCLAAALYCAVRTRESARWFTALGAVLMVAYFVRPTNAVPLVAFGIWSLVRGRASFRRYVIAAAGVALVFAAVDFWLYGRGLQPYFRANRLGLSGAAVEALTANLVSPGRGLIVFVPAVLVCGYGVIVKRRRGALTSLDVTVLSTVVGYWLIVSCFPHWWGGWAYGPRMLCDVAPLAIWFLPAALEAIVDQRRVALGIVAVVLIGLSVAVQAAGALDAGTAAWNWTPNDIDRVPARVWDWNDPQFLR